MAKRHCLYFVLRGCENQRFFVSEQESDELDARLLNAQDDDQGAAFVWFETLDGLSVAVNLAYVQGVRFLWDAVLSEDVHAANDEPSSAPICLQFAGKEKVIEADTENPETVFDLFTQLDIGLDGFRYPSFVDEDGELFRVNPKELIYISAPTAVLDEGEEIVQKENDL